MLYIYFLFYLDNRLLNSYSLVQVWLLTEFIFEIQRFTTVIHIRFIRVKVNNFLRYVLLKTSGNSV